MVMFENKASLKQLPCLTYARELQQIANESVISFGRKMRKIATSL